MIYNDPCSTVQNTLLFFLLSLFTSRILIYLVSFLTSTKHTWFLKQNIFQNRPNCQNGDSFLSSFRPIIKRKPQSRFLVLENSPQLFYFIYWTYLFIYLDTQIWEFLHFSVGYTPWPINSQIFKTPVPYNFDRSVSESARPMHYYNIINACRCFVCCFTNFYCLKLILKHNTKFMRETYLVTFPKVQSCNEIIFLFLILWKITNWAYLISFVKWSIKNHHNHPPPLIFDIMK